MVCCNREPNLRTISVDEEILAEQIAIIRNFLVDGYDGNKLEWQLKGKKAYIDWQKQRIRLISPFLKYWNEDGKITRISGEFGDLDEQNHTLYVEKNVKVISHNKRKLFTEHLYWYEKKRQLTTTAKVKILMPDGSMIHGKRMQADMNLNKITLEETWGEYGINQLE